jgi:hypothetical protein
MTSWHCSKLVDANCGLQSPDYLRQSFHGHLYAMVDFETVQFRENRFVVETSKSGWIMQFLSVLVQIPLVRYARNPLLS